MAIVTLYFAMYARYSVPMVTKTFFHGVAHGAK